MTRDLPRLGLRRLSIRARLAGWSVRSIAKWLMEDPARVRRWLRAHGHTVQGPLGGYIFNATRGARLSLSLDELLATGAWPDGAGCWRGRSPADGAPVPERDWLLPARR